MTEDGNKSSKVPGESDDDGDERFTGDVAPKKSAEARQLADLTRLVGLSSAISNVSKLNNPRSAIAKQLAHATKLAGSNSAFAQIAKLNSPSSAIAKQFAEATRLTGENSAIAQIAKMNSPSSAIAKQFADATKLAGSNSAIAQIAKMNSPSSAIAKQLAHATKLAGSNSAFAQIAKLNSPSAAIAKQFADATKLAGPNSAFAQIAKLNSPSAAIAKQFADATKLAGSNSAIAQIAKMNSPSSAIAKQLAHATKLAGSSSAFSQIAKLAGSNAAISKQFADIARIANSSSTFRGHFDNKERAATYTAAAAAIRDMHPMTLAELAPIVGAVDGFPQSVVREQSLAEQLVTIAANENKLNDVLGTSLAVDLAAAERFIESEGRSGLPRFFDQFSASINFHFERVRSLAELFDLYNAATLMVAVLAVWYAMDSATTEDVKGVQSAIISQTEAMREEARISRDQIASKIDELLRGINEHTARKSTMFTPAMTYVVKRAIPIKSERQMKSATVGVLQVGQAVFRLDHWRKWIYVEGSDLLTGERVAGWVMKKYLKRLP